MTDVIPKKQLKIEIKRFFADVNRGISINLFAELCGLHKTTLIDVFINEVTPLSEYVQIRVSKGYKRWQEGHVAVMQNRDNTRFVQYRKEPKPKLIRKTGLHVVNGEIKIKLGIQNKGDYSHSTLDEQLQRG